MTRLGLYGAGVLIVYELLVLRAAQSSIKAGPNIPDWFGTINVVIEMSVPALGVRSSMQEGDIVFLITDGFLEWENAAGE